MEKNILKKMKKILFTSGFLLLAYTKSFGYDQKLSPDNHTQFGSIVQNEDGSVSFNLILNNDIGCNDVWDWITIEAILPDDSRVEVINGNDEYLLGYDFMVDDPNDDINMYFFSNYTVSLESIFDTDGGDLHIRVKWHNPPILKPKDNFVLKGRWKACGNDWVGQWTGDEWMRTVYQVYTGHTPQAGTKTGIMQYWAPRVYHDTRDEEVCIGSSFFNNCIGYTYRFYKEQDMLASVNFDNDWDARNNWENNCHGNNGNPIAPKAFAYSSFVETETHYFLGYHYFHPTDDAEIPDDRHENDMEDVYICVKKGDNTSFGTFKAMLTNAHGDYKTYSQSNLHFTKGHPHIFITSNGTGLADYSGLFGWDDHGHSIYMYNKCSNGDFGGDDGIIYNVANKGEVPESCDERNDGTAYQYNYALVEINELWNRRFNTTSLPFRSYGSFGGEGDDGKGPGAYISWSDPELNNPAVKFLEYFPELDDDGIWSYTYLHNPYIYGNNGNDADLKYRGKLPAGWYSQNIGSPSLNGLAYFTHSTFTVDGAGQGILGTSDQFHYVYTNLSGNGEIVARVYSIQEDINEWSKAGVMIRESADAGSKFAMMTSTSANGGSFQYRQSTGGGCGHETNGALTNPLWLKLNRTGDIFTAYYSTDGSSWVQQGNPKTLPMNSNVLIGLAITSHNPDWLCSATIDNVSVNGVLTILKSAAESYAEETLINNDKLMIYPNPLSGNELHLDLSGFKTKEKVQLMVISMDGQVAFQKTYSGTQNLTLNKDEIFTQGICLIQLISEGTMLSRKLIVE